MADATIELEIQLDDGELIKGFAKIPSELQKAGQRGGDQASQAFNVRFSRAVESFFGNFAATFARDLVSGLTRELDELVNAAAELEVFETQFRTLLGSAAAAQKQLEDLQNFAASTPFQLQGLALATRQLLSFGVVQKDIIPTLRQLGDLAAGTGSQIQDLTIPFGRLIATQKLTLVELDKFADRGINIYKNLADQTGKSIKDIRDEISKGRVPFEEFTKAIDSLTGPGGKFFQATLAQSKTLTGALSTLGDAVFNLRGALGGLFRPFLIAQTNSTIKSINSFTVAIRNARKAITEFLFDVAVFVGRNIQLVGDRFVGLKITLKAVVSGISSALRTVLKIISDLGQKILKVPGFGSFGAVISNSAKEGISGLNAIESRLRGFVELLPGLGINAKVEEFLAELRKLLEGSEDVVGGTEKIFKFGSKSILFEVQKLVDGVNKLFNQGLANIISQAIQRITTRLLEGQSVFSQFGVFLLNLFGDLAIQIGTFIIAFALAIEAFKGSIIGSAGAAIALGAGLVAIGAALKVFASKNSSAISAGGAGGGGGTSFGGVPDTGFEEPELDQGPSATVIFNVQGSILSADETADNIVDLVNDAFTQRGVRILQS